MVPCMYGRAQRVQKQQQVKEIEEAGQSPVVDSSKFKEFKVESAEPRPQGARDRE